MTFSGHEKRSAFVSCRSTARNAHPAIGTTGNWGEVFFIEGDVGAARSRVSVANAVAALDGGDRGLGVNCRTAHDDDDDERNCRSEDG